MIIRDPVHGDIEVTPREAEVLDTAEVQRLRGIRQTGTAYLVYPGCLHTRFEHSLGAMHMAKSILSSLARQPVRGQGAGRRRGGGIDPALAEAVALAALLHDVTHIPFGHTLEDERGLFPRHDRGGRLARLLDGEVGAVLRRLGQFERVQAILEHKGGKEASGRVPPWAAEVVASTIDADLLDYLARDAYFAGLRQSYDGRIFAYFREVDGHLAFALTKDGQLRHDARSELLQLLRLRYFLTERVYFHHAKVASGAMVAKAVEIALDHGFREEEALWLSDAGLFERLRSLPRPGSPDPRLVRLVERLERRRLYKRGYVLSPASLSDEERRRWVARYHLSLADRQRAEGEVAAILGCGADEVILYCPQLTAMKEAAALVETGNGLASLDSLEGPSASEIQGLKEQYAALWRFYLFVPAHLAERASRAGEEVFGLPSEYRAGGGAR